MGLVTVNEYSKLMGVTIQSVYQRIKKGTLPYETKDGLKMIQSDTKGSDTSIPNHTKASCIEIVKDYKLMTKDFKQQIKDLKRQRKDLKKQLKHSKEDKDKSYIRL